MLVDEYTKIKNFTIKSYKNTSILVKISSIRCWIVIICLKRSTRSPNNKLNHESLKLCIKSVFTSIKQTNIYSNNLNLFKSKLNRNLTDQFVDHSIVYVQLKGMLAMECITKKMSILKPRKPLLNFCKTFQSVVGL